MDTWIQEFKTRSSLPNMDTQTQFSNIKTSERILQAWFLILEFEVKTVHQLLSGVVEEFFLKGSFSFVSFLYYFLSHVSHFKPFCTTEEINISATQKLLPTVFSNL